MFILTFASMVSWTKLSFFALLYLNMADLFDKLEFLCTHLEIACHYRKVWLW